MKKYLNQSFLILIVIFFGACSGKDMKQYGGNLALNGGGNPLMTGVGLAVGGTLYGIGSLIENNEKPSVEDKEKYGNLYTEKVLIIMNQN